MATMMNLLFEAKQALVNTSWWPALRDLILEGPVLVKSQINNSL